MISSLRGTVLRSTVTGTGSTVTGSAVIEVGGIGYAVSLTADHAMSLHEGDEVFVHTSLIVREDALSLFAFASTEELGLFELLLGVNGVGPKSALGVLGGMSPAEVAAAVQQEDDASFRRISGIGPKTAKLIVVSLAGRLPAFVDAQEAGSVRAAIPTTTVADDVVLALVGLGWVEKVARETVTEVLSELGEAADEASTASVPALLRRCLALLGTGVAR